MMALRRIAAVALVAACAVALAAAASPSVGVAHVLASSEGVLGNAASTMSAAELGRLWQSAAADATSQLVVAIDGAPLTGAMGQIAADAKATFGLVSGKSNNALFLNELFTGADAAPVARRSKGANVVLTAPTEPASLHDLIAAAAQGESLVLSVASTEDALAVSTVHAELRSSWATDAVLLGAQVAPDASTLAGRIHAAVGTLAPLEAAKLVDAAGKPVFSMAEAADAMFLREAAALQAVATELAQQSGKATRDAAPASLVTIVLSSLSALRESYGVDSAQYQAAWAHFNAAVPDLASRFTSSAASSASLVTVVAMAHQAPTAPATRSVRSNAERSTSTPRLNANGPVEIGTCYGNFSVCNTTSSGCSGQGSCVATSLNGRECFVCACNVDYAGESCQYFDISSIFWIMLFTSVTLIIAVVITSITLCTIDPGTSTVLFKTAASGRSKSE